jgi:hypothetical protein
MSMHLKRTLLLASLFMLTGCPKNPTNGPCSTTADCSEGYVCSDGQCTKICKLESDCPEGQTCQDEVCIDLTACSGTECGLGNTCRDGFCRYACAGDDECTLAGMECNKGACLPIAPPEGSCDGLDDNNNGKIDETYDKDGDRYTTCGSFNGTTYGTPDSAYVDCNDNSAAVNPGQLEVCDNNVDEDCSDVPDDGICMQDLRLSERRIVSGAGKGVSASYHATVSVGAPAAGRGQGGNVKVQSVVITYH